MPHPEFNFLGGCKDELVEIVDDELEGLRAIFINLYNLMDNRCIEGLILHLAKE